VEQLENTAREGGRKRKRKKSSPSDLLSTVDPGRANYLGRLNRSEGKSFGNVPTEGEGGKMEEEPEAKRFAYIHVLQGLGVANPTGGEELEEPRARSVLCGARSKECFA